MFDFVLRSSSVPTSLPALSLGRRVLALLLSLGICGATLPVAMADPSGDAARALVERHKGALVVVTVVGKLTTKTTGEALPEQPQQRRTLGVTVLDNGLVVVSNSAIDASIGLEGQRARNGETVVTIASAGMEFTKVEISYGDSTVLPGEVIMQRPEADLAFILPDAGAAKRIEKTTFDKVDLTKYGSIDIADEVVGLSRSSATYGFMPTVLIGRVTGIFRGDRTYYVNTAGTAHGVPVFGLDGAPIGITLERIVDGQRTGILGTLAATSIEVQARLAMEALASKQKAR